MSKRWEDMTPRERDALVAEKVTGRCWHEFVDDREHAQSVARQDFEDRYGEPAPYGWRPWEGCWAVRCEKCGRRWDPPSHELGPRADQDVPKYTTDIAAAWEVVEKMREDGFQRRIYVTGPVIGDIQPRDNPVQLWVGEDASAPYSPEAICRAALRAKGVEV